MKIGIILVSTILGFSLCGCATPSQIAYDGKGDFPTQDVSFPSASATVKDLSNYAEILARSYRVEASDYYGDTDLLTLGALGTALASAGGVIYGANTDLMGAFGLGAGAAYTTNSTLKIEDRGKTFADAASELECIVGVAHRSEFYSAKSAIASLRSLPMQNGKPKFLGLAIRANQTQLALEMSSLWQKAATAEEDAPALMRDAITGTIQRADGKINHDMPDYKEIGKNIAEYQQAVTQTHNSALIAEQQVGDIKSLRAELVSLTSVGDAATAIDQFKADLEDCKVK